MAWWNPSTWGQDDTPSTTQPSTAQSNKPKLKYKKSGPNSRPTFTNVETGATVRVGTNAYNDAMKEWQKNKRRGDMVKNYARGGGVRPANNEYK